MNWWCPPVYLMPHWLQHAQHCACKGYFSPALLGFSIIIILDGISFAPFVHDFSLLENLFTSHKSGSSGFFSYYQDVSIVI